MIRKTSTKYTTTYSSSIHKKKRRNRWLRLDFSFLHRFSTSFSLCDKIFPLLDKAPSKDSISGNGAFLALSNTDEMSEISTSDKSVVTHGRTHADGMRQHVQQSNKAGKVVIVDGVETMQHTLFGGRKN